MTCFGILGGDRRQLYLARSLREDGHPVSLCGLERGEGAEGFPQLSPEELGQLCQVVLLPLPATRDGITLNAPLARAPILLDSGLAQNLKGCTVLAGMAGGLRKSSPLWEALPVLDYYAREELTLGNAFLTAEGAVALAVEHSPGALGGSRCLVAGFGRIGKALCLALRGMGAQVDCAARKPWDLAAIRALGCTPVLYGGLAAPYDVIFNTVPAPVIGEELLPPRAGHPAVGTGQRPRRHRPGRGGEARPLPAGCPLSAGALFPQGLGRIDQRGCVPHAARKA